MIRISDKLQLIGSTFVSQILRILTTLVLARLLTPSDYGLVALVTSLPGILTSLGDFGIARGVVQVRDLPEETVIDTGFVLTLLIGICYAAISIVSGIYLTWLYSDPRIIWLSLINAMTGIAWSVYSFQLACLSRKMKFSQESGQNIVYASAQALTGIGLAFAGCGVYTLAIQPLTAQLASNIMIFRAQPLSWPSQFRKVAAKRLINFGWRVVLSQYVNNAQTSVINLVVAGYFGPAGLGILGRATQIRDLVGWNLMVSFDRLLFPLMSNVQAEAARMKSVFLRGCAGVTIIAALGGAWLSVNSSDLVLLMLGAKWAPAAPLLSILAPALLITALCVPCITAALSLAKPSNWLWYSVVNLLLLIPLSLVAGKFGLAAVCFAMIFSQLVATVGFVWWTLRMLGCSFGELFRRLAPIYAAVALSTGSMFFLRLLLLQAAPLIIRVSIVSLVGLGVCGLILLLVDSESIAEIRGLLFRPQTPPAPEVA